MIEKGIGVSQLRKGAHASRPTAEHPAPTACASGVTSCVSCLLIYRGTEEYPSFGFDPKLPPALRNPSQGAVKGAQAILRYSLFAPPPAESQCFAWLPGRCTLSALAFLLLPEAAASPVAPPFPGGVQPFRSDRSSSSKVKSPPLPSNVARHSPSYKMVLVHILLYEIPRTGTEYPWRDWHTGTYQLN